MRKISKPLYLEKNYSNFLFLHCFSEINYSNWTETISISKIFIYRPINLTVFRKTPTDRTRFDFQKLSTMIDSDPTMLIQYLSYRHTIVSVDPFAKLLCFSTNTGVINLPFRTSINWKILEFPVKAREWFNRTMIRRIFTQLLFKFAQIFRLVYFCCSPILKWSYGLMIGFCINLRFVGWNYTIFTLFWNIHWWLGSEILNAAVT